MSRRFFSISAWRRKRTFSSSTLWCSNNDLRALIISVSDATPWDCWRKTVGRIERSWRETSCSKCSNKIWKQRKYFHPGKKRILFVTRVLFRSALSSLISFSFSANFSRRTVKSSGEFDASWNERQFSSIFLFDRLILNKKDENREKRRSTRMKNFWRLWKTWENGRKFFDACWFREFLSAVMSGHECRALRRRESISSRTMALSLLIEPIPIDVSSKLSSSLSFWFE